MDLAAVMVNNSQGQLPVLGEPLHHKCRDTAAIDSLLDPKLEPAILTARASASDAARGAVNVTTDPEVAKVLGH
jgi:hypothetical protein